MNSSEKYLPISIKYFQSFTEIKPGDVIFMSFLLLSTDQYDIMTLNINMLKYIIQFQL